MWPSESCKSKYVFPLWRVKYQVSGYTVNTHNPDSMDVFTKQCNPSIKVQSGRFPTRWSFFPLVLYHHLLTSVWLPEISLAK